MAPDELQGVTGGATAPAECRIESRRRLQGSFHVREWYEAVVTPPAGPPFVMLYSRETVRKRLGAEDGRARKAKAAALASLVGAVETMGWRREGTDAPASPTTSRPLVYRATPHGVAPQSIALHAAGLRRVAFDAVNGGDSVGTEPSADAPRLFGPSCLESPERLSPAYTLGSRLEQLSSLIEDHVTTLRERERAHLVLLREAEQEAERIRAAAREQSLATYQQAVRENEALSARLLALERELTARATLLDIREEHVQERELAVAAAEQRNQDEGRWLKRYARQVEEIIQSLNRVTSDAPRQIGDNRSRSDSA